MESSTLSATTRSRRRSVHHSSRGQRRSTVMSLSGTMRSNDDEPLEGAAMFLERIRRRWAFARSASTVGTTVGAGDAVPERLSAGEHFPTFEELALLPDRVRQAVHARAMGVLKSTLLPAIAVRLRLRARRGMIEDLKARGVDLKAPTAVALNGLGAFSRWSNLREVADKFEPSFYSRGETVVHEGEPHTTGLCLLGHGIVDAADPVQLPPGFKLGRGVNVAAGDGRTAGSVVGDCGILTEQPQRRRIRCLSDECVVWRLSAPAYAAALAEQDAAVQAAAADTAAALRVANMRDAYRRLLLPPALQRHREFATFDSALLSAAGERAVPKVFRPGATIYEAGAPATSLFIVVSGNVSLSRPVDRAASPRGFVGRNRTMSVATTQSSDSAGAAEGGSGARRVHPLAVIGGISWIQNLDRAETAVAETTVDCFCITRDSVKAELAAQRTADVPRLVLGDDDASDLRYLQAATQIPFLASAVEHAVAAAEAAQRRADGGEFAHLYGKRKKKNNDRGPWDVFKDVARAVELRIFEEGVSICGTAMQVDQLIIPLTGKAKVVLSAADGGRSVSRASPTLSPSPRRGGSPSSLSLPMGECIGFPLLVPHRWSHRVIVVRQLEALTLSYDAYAAILEKHGLAKRVTALSHAVLYPDAAKREVRDAAEEALSLLKGPALHPVTSLQSIATGTAPLQATVAASGVADVATITSGKGPSVCRKPTEEQLRKLKPIPVRTGMSCAVLSSDSKSRIIGGGRKPPANTPPPRLVPLVLGKQPRVTFGYGEALPKVAPIGSGVAGSSKRR